MWTKDSQSHACPRGSSTLSQTGGRASAAGMPWLAAQWGCIALSCQGRAWQHACRYCIWWGITIALAAFTGVYEPWVVAFLGHAER